MKLAMLCVAMAVGGGLYLGASLAMGLHEAGGMTRYGMRMLTTITGRSRNPS